MYVNCTPGTECNGGGCLRQIHSCHKVPFQVIFLDDDILPCLLWVLTFYGVLSTEVNYGLAIFRHKFLNILVKKTRSAWRAVLRTWTVTWAPIPFSPGASGSPSLPGSGTYRFSGPFLPPSSYPETRGSPLHSPLRLRYPHLPPLFQEQMGFSLSTLDLALGSTCCIPPLILRHVDLHSPLGSGILTSLL